MMTLRLGKVDPTRTEFYEYDCVRLGTYNEDGVLSIAGYSGRGDTRGAMVEHFLGSKPGMAREAIIMNSKGNTIDILRAGSGD